MNAPIRLFAAVLTLLAVGAPATAEEDHRTLFDVLRLEDVISVMRDEGVAYGEQLESELFPGQGGEAWQDTVARIYGGDRMVDRVARDFSAALDGVDTATALEFFDSELGQRIVSLEIDARRALEDEEVEQAAGEAAQDLPAPRLDRIETFIEANDLLEQNVTGAMNANYAFFQGLDAGGALLPGLTEDEMIADVWAQEPDIRAETEDWLLAYLALAYQPLEDGELDDYIAFSRSEAGRALNRAVFAAFDGLYEDISRDLGIGAAGFMQGEDI